MAHGGTEKYKNGWRKEIKKNWHKAGQIASTVISSDNCDLAEDLGLCPKINRQPLKCYK